MPNGSSTTTISLRPELMAAALVRAKDLGFETSFSAYVAKLIREDIERNAKEELSALRSELSQATDPDHKFTLREKIKKLDQQTRYPAHRATAASFSEKHSPRTANRVKKVA